MKFVPFWLVCVALFLPLSAFAPTAHANVERLGEDKLILSGSISRGDIDRIAKILIDQQVKITEVVVNARGVGSTAWEVVHELSRLLQDYGVKVNLLYAEDAAIAIQGAGLSTKQGKQIAWKPIDIRRDQEIRVRVFESTYENGVYRSTTRIVSESFAPTFDRFNMVCKARVPREARDLGIYATDVVGKHDDKVDRRGVRDTSGHIWFYVNTNGSGRWKHDEPQAAARVVQKATEDAQKKLDRLKAQSALLKP
jgi:hypothetical protein